MRINFLIILSGVLLYTSLGFSKEFKIPLREFDITFFNKDEKKLLDHPKKEKLLKRDLGTAFLLVIAPDLRDMGMPWIHDELENIHDIFNDLLRTFAYDAEIYQIKTDAESSYTDLEDEDIPSF